MQAYVQIALDSAKEREVLDRLAKMGEVREVHILFGEWDMIAKIELKDPEKIGNFIMENIRSLPGVKMTSTMIIAK